jgi:hypothetical protein
MSQYVFRMRSKKMQFPRGTKTRFFHVVIAGLALVGMALGSGSIALAKAKAGKKADKPQVVLGTVKAVDDKSITVETKKGGSQQFQLSADTTYKLKGKKGAAEETAARTDLKEGQRVAVMAKDDQAQSVVIEHPHKKTKKNA